MALLHQKWRESFRRTAEFAAHLLLFVSELSKVVISAPHKLCGFKNFPWKKGSLSGEKKIISNIYVVYCYVNKKPRNCWTVLEFTVHQVFCCYQRFCFVQPTTSELKVDKTDSEKEAKKVVTWTELRSQNNFSWGCLPHHLARVTTFNVRILSKAEETQ